MEDYILEHSLPRASSDLWSQSWTCRVCWKRDETHTNVHTMHCCIYRERSKQTYHQRTKSAWIISCWVRLVQGTSEYLAEEGSWLFASKPCIKLKRTSASGLRCRLRQHCGRGAPRASTCACWKVFAGRYPWIYALRVLGSIWFYTTSGYSTSGFGRHPSWALPHG